MTVTMHIQCTDTISLILNNTMYMYIVVRNLKTMRSNFLTPVTPFSFTQNKQGHVYIQRF